MMDLKIQVGECRTGRESRTGNTCDDFGYGFMVYLFDYFFQYCFANKSMIGSSSY